MDENDYIPAKSLEEAERLFNEALDAEDFERAGFYQDEIDEFKNFNEVLENAKNVHTYIEDTNAIDNQMTIMQSKVEENLQKTRDGIINRYNKKFLEIKARQKQELIDLLNQWTNEREKFTNNNLEEYKRTIETAKILVRQSKLKEAIIMRDKARELKNRADTSEKDLFDQKYEKLCLALEVRHRAELDQFMELRKEDLQKIDLMIDNAYVEKDRQFMLENSTAVINAAGKYTTVNPVPQSLNMQTVNYQKDMIYISKPQNSP